MQGMENAIVRKITVPPLNLHCKPSVVRGELQLQLPPQPQPQPQLQLLPQLPPLPRLPRLRAPLFVKGILFVVLGSFEIKYISINGCHAAFLRFSFCESPGLSKPEIFIN